jgi:CheY-like chemotaxis protein
MSSGWPAPAASGSRDAHPLRRRSRRHHPRRLPAARGAGTPGGDGLHAGDARRLCTANAFDLLLCDIGLPDGEGWELGEVAARCGVKAVATTGSGMADDVHKSKSAGFVAHVLKPYTVGMLEEAISLAAAP